MTGLYYLHSVYLLQLAICVKGLDLIYRPLLVISAGQLIGRVPSLDVAAD
jgi:hypothetical protein